MGRDFEKNPFTGKYELKYPLVVLDSAKRYTVEETLHTVEGFTVSTSYTIDGGESSDGTDVMLNGVSEDS